MTKEIDPFLASSITYTSMRYRMYDIISQQKCGKTYLSHKVATALIAKGYKVHVLDFELIRDGWAAYTGVPIHKVPTYQALLDFFYISRQNKEAASKTIIIVDSATDMCEIMWSTHLKKLYGDDLYGTIKVIGTKSDNAIKLINEYKRIFVEALQELRDTFGFVIMTSHIKEKIIAKNGETWIKQGLNYFLNDMTEFALSVADANILLTPQPKSKIPLVNQTPDGTSAFGFGWSNNPGLDKVKNSNQLIEHMIDIIPKMIDGVGYTPPTKKETATKAVGGWN